MLLGPRAHHRHDFFDGRWGAVSNPPECRFPPAKCIFSPNDVCHVRFLLAPLRHHASNPSTCARQSASGCCAFDCIKPPNTLARSVFGDVSNRLTRCIHKRTFVNDVDKLSVSLIQLIAWVPRKLLVVVRKRIVQARGVPPSVQNALRHGRPCPQLHPRAKRHNVIPWVIGEHGHVRGPVIIHQRFAKNGVAVHVHKPAVI